MRDFEIVTDSCCDLPLNLIKERNIPYVSLTFRLNGEEFTDDFGMSLSFKNFYDRLRNGEMIKTSQPSTNEYYEKFSNIAKCGKDILYVCVSSGLSGTYNGVNIAKSMIQEDHPDAKIEIVDTRTASLGQGLWVLKALEMKEAGASIDEITSYMEKGIQHLNTYMIVDDLGYLKRGGRISNTVALIGAVLHVKPLLTLNDEGRVIPVLKVKGKKKALNKIAEIVSSRIEDCENQVIGISHGDCEDDAMRLKELILKNNRVKDVIISNIGAAVGAFGGPGALAVYFTGKNRNHRIDVE